jgi:signal transduction histidine kinase/CheY-like chemotaxis protein
MKEMGARRAPDAPGPIQLPRLPPPLVAAALLFVVALAIGALYELDRSQREAQLRATQEIDALARVFAEQTRRSLQTVDIMLRSVAVAHRDHTLPPLDSRAMHDELAAQRDQFSDVAALFVTDPHGTRLSSSTSYPPPPGTVAGNALVRGLQAGAGDACVGEPVRSMTTGRWVVPLARRLEGPGGRFDGTVGALLDASYFDNFYAAVHLERGTSVALLHEGGTLVARFPRQDAQVGRPVPEYRDLSQAEAASDPPSVLRGSTRGSNRIAVARPVPGFAMTVVVTRELSEVMAPWREQALGVVLRTVILTLMVAALLAMMLRHLARVNAARAQLRQAQKLEAMGTLAGGIAHDFNNILGAILGYGELARSGAEPGSALARQLDGVMSAGQRAKALVERILAFSRSGLGERVPVHVQSVVAEALDLLLPSLPPGITLSRTLEAGDTAVIGDATQIHQVVMNLCTNAMHAMQHGGTLAVSLALRHRDATLALTTGELPAGDYVCLTVRDQGQGIEPQVLDRIFDPFFTTKGVGVGTGLGLSLVHGIVTDLGGGIEVASVPGTSTTFTVWLPWSGRALAQSQAGSQIPRGDGQRILLVDDEVALVHLGEEMLAALGYEAAGYTSSVEALAAFAAEPQRFDAVLSDETMPQLSGSQMALKVRQIRPDIPIVLMSGYVGPNIAALARQSNVDELLPKPLVSRDIARTLAGLFAK